MTGKSKDTDATMSFSFQDDQKQTLHVLNLFLVFVISNASAVGFCGGVRIEDDIWPLVIDGPPT